MNRLTMNGLRVALLLSGAAALMYQVVWQRMLATILGVTVYSATIVIASFMAGLALGSRFGGSAADRVQRPLRLFALAEILLAVIGPMVGPAIGYAQVLFAQSGDAGLQLRAIVAFGVLVLPTTLMGITLPAVIAALPDARRSTIASLYGWNTLGACAGALLAGYVTIGLYGLHLTSVMAATMNALAAGAAFLIGRRPRIATKDAPDAPVSSEPAAGLQTQGLPSWGWLAAAAATSGFVALGLEVVWFRLLLAYLPTTTYAFTTMLATVLAGIGLGGVVASRRGAPGGNPATALATIGVLFVAAGAMSVISASLLAWTYSAGWRTSGLVQACILCLFPATFAMGLSYPRLLAVASLRAGARGRSVGSLGAWNLLGGLMGSVLAGFWLVPAIGVRRALILLAAMVATGGLLLLGISGARTTRSLWAAGAWALALAASALALPDPFEAARARRHRGEALVWSEEGRQGTVAVHRGAAGETILYIDGSHQADDRLGMRGLHERLGLTPLMLHDGPRRGLVIGLAGGATPGALGLDPALSMDIVELSDSVVRASDAFRHVNRSVLNRPGVTLRVDDGRNFLLRTKERYDIVTADLVQPFHAGAGLLYSKEYFELCREVLNEGGLMVQWIGHPPAAQYQLIARTFLAAFPYVTLWDQAFFVGSNRPIRVSPKAYARAAGVREWRDGLTRAGIATEAALEGLRSADGPALRSFIGHGPVLTDDHPAVEYFRSVPRSAAIDLSPLIKR